MDKKVLGYACVDDNGLDYVMCQKGSDQPERTTRKLGLPIEKAHRVAAITKEDTLRATRRIIPSAD